jgi:hypothetical protein
MTDKDRDPMITRATPSLATRWPTMRRRPIVRLVLVLGVAIAVFGAYATASATSDTASVRATVNAAIHTQQEVGLPPLGYNGGVMPPQMAATMTDQGKLELAKVFGGPELNRRDQVLQLNIDGQRSGQIRSLAAGVSRIDITSVTITGDRAEVTASADLWADVAQVQSGGALAVAHPKNTKLYELTLEKVGGTWLVVDESSTFAPGSAP